MRIANRALSWRTNWGPPNGYGQQIYHPPLGGSTDTPEEGVCCPWGCCTGHYVGTENAVRGTLDRLGSYKRRTTIAKMRGAG